ncbi:MAG: hypothetical protein PVI01_06340 [Gemmatimonadales bacterium]|jgi:photosystem II stability/assembly factor-like uncharacterized protein
MKNPILLAGILLAGLAGAGCAPDYRWTEQSSGVSVEFRGLSAAGSNVVWAAGRQGTYVRTVDGGETWTSGTVAGAEDLFFIDVHAVNASTAYLLGTYFDGSLAKIFKTVDGGAVWIEQYSDTTPGVFFDGLAFWDAENGIAFSDPVADGFLIVTTQDGGASWNRVPPEVIPPPQLGEAGFAASGTAITVYGDSNVWFGTGGGRVARVYRSTDRGRSWSVAETPLAADSTTGIFGITFWDEYNGLAVGGDHTRPQDGVDNVARTRDGGRTWTLAGSARPAGVRWGIAYVRGVAARVIVATGPSGWGYSTDSGASWQVGDTVGFNTVAAAPSTDIVWLAGTRGRVAKLQFPAR